MAKKLFYKIGEACKLLDIQPYVLRYWETEFPFLSPGKSRSGQRVYSGKEIELIRRMKVLLYEEGYTIAGAKKRLEADLPGILQSSSLDDLDIDDDVFAARLAGTDKDAAAPSAKPSAKPSATPSATPAAVAAANTARPAGQKADAASAVVIQSGDDGVAVAITETLVETTTVTTAVATLDSGAALTIKTLRAGIAHALGEAKDLLALLETPAGQSKPSSAARR